MKLHLTHPVFATISEISEVHNTPVYVIGGFVRDILLERNSTDIDIVIQGSGIDLAKEVANKLEIKNIHFFKNFGTAMLIFENYKIEFVGARKESYRYNSRKPIVEDGSIEDDQNRRDFTINALAIDLRKETYGNLVDPFKGIDDLNSKIIRTPLDPDITFSDDPLRMLRAIRFASQLDFRIEKNTLLSISKNVERINIVSKERIIEELNKIILSHKPSVGFILLLNSGLLKIIFPELFNLLGVDIRDSKSHKDNFFHTMEVLDKVAEKSDNLWLRWAAILHDIAKPLTKKFNKTTGWTFHNHDFKGSKMISSIFRDLKLPLNDNLKYVESLVLLHLRPIVLVKSEITDSAIRRLLFEAGNNIDDLMLLCEADITSKNDIKVKKYLKNFNIVREKMKDIEEKDKLRNWEPPISGEIIMQTFNLKPSVKVGIIKTAIREAILNGEIKNNFDDAYNYMIKIALTLGLKK